MNTEGDNKGWTLSTNYKPHPIVTPKVKSTHLTNNPYHSLQGDDEYSITNLQVIALDGNCLCIACCLCSRRVNRCSCICIAQRSYLCQLMYS